MIAVATDQKPSSRTLASLVNALGTDDFETETLRFLNRTSGAERYYICRLRDGHPQFLGGASIAGERTSPHPARVAVELEHAKGAADQCSGALVIRDATLTVRTPVDCSPTEGDRVLVCGRAADDFYAVSITKSRDVGDFVEAELSGLAASAEMIVAACAKHAALQWDRKKVAAHFASVKTIEKKLRASDWPLSERELQVAARILFGISACGISLDLDLGEETIATYRKRLYARMRISSRHELFQRYLSLL